MLISYDHLFSDSKISTKLVKCIKLVIHVHNCHADTFHDYCRRLVEGRLSSDICLLTFQPQGFTYTPITITNLNTLITITIN